MSRLTDRVVIITGGATGLGAELMRAFSAEGAIAVAAARSTSLPDGVPGDLVTTDITQEADVARLVHTTLERHGRIDVLVNNAAIWHRKPFTEIDAAEWDQVYAVNVKGPFLLSKAIAPVMAGQGGGSIVNVGSQAGFSYTRGQGAHYQSSKAALSQLTRVLAFEFGPLNVRVNCVASGVIWSKPGEPPRETYGWILDQTPLGRFATPQDLAESCLFLASDAALSVTGQTFAVNGGAIGYV